MRLFLPPEIVDHTLGRMDRRVPAVDGENPIFSQSRRSCIHSLWLAAWIMALVTPRLSADITLVSRLSDARAFAVIGVGSDSPPPQIQTDFLPATLSNSAAVSAESGAASANCTSNSSIVADNQMGTLQITGDGEASAYAILMGSYGHGSAKLIVTSFTLTDRSYSYSLTGQLLAEQFKGVAESTGTAKLTAGGVTIFEVVAAHPPAVILSQTGVLEPGDYTLSVEIDAAGSGAQGPHAGVSRGSANFNFAVEPPTLTPTPSPTPTPVPTPTPTPRPATLGNISTRLQVGSGDRVMIAGFIVQGSAPKRVLIRAAGPSLANFGVPNPLANSRLELHDFNGTVGMNDDWQTTQIGGVITADQGAEIQSSGLAPSDPLESAMIATLPPGSYTAIVQGISGGTGVGIVEVYDLNATSGSLLANISTRGFVQTGDNAMIGGFIVVTQPTRVIIRAIGPSLGQFGVPDALANPQLELHDATSTIAQNNDWQITQLGGIITSDQVAEIQNSQFAPTNPTESALIATLPPGSYTAIVRGVNNTTGNALVEVYSLQ